jgi:hypothetical protein
LSDHGLHSLRRYSRTESDPHLNANLTLCKCISNDCGTYSIVRSWGNQGKARCIHRICAALR